MSVVHIVSHTHWDREWYKPFQYFRVKLVYAMDKAIDTLENDERFEHYLFDGQTVVLEDYLQVKPQNAERIKALVSDGRLIVGPWYTQPDEFAPDGESLIRNLLIGINIANDFGQSMMVGYLPDSFGQSGQMPHILAGFGIGSAVMMRGVPSNMLGVSEFMWEGLNGDQVIAVYLPDGYSNGMFLPKSKEKDAIRIKRIAEKLSEWATTENVLVMNGIDHQFIQPHIADHIEYLNEADGDTKYVHSTIENYIECIRKSAPSKTIKGELIAPDRNRVHTSIASTRIYQKIKNRRSQTLIEKYVEPICAMGWLMGGEYPKELINQAWKYLFQIQAHDGICGCCTDEVHRDIDQRFVDINNVANTLVKGYSRAIAHRISSSELILLAFNSSMTVGKQLVCATVYTKAQNFTLIDALGEEVPYCVDDMEDIDAAGLNIFALYLGTAEEMKKIQISFIADFEFHFGYKVYTVKKGKKATDYQPSIIIRENCMENAFNIVKICSNGSVELFDKTTRKTYKNLNVFEDVGDAGDTYNFCPVQDDCVVTSHDADANIEIVEKNRHKVSAHISMTMQIPKKLASSGLERSQETVQLPIRTKLTMYAHTPRIDFETTVDNCAFDHRLRVLFGSDVLSDCSYAETQFGSIRRNNTVDTTRWKEEKWSEKPLPIYSMQRFVDVHDDKYGIAVLNRGLTEYEIYQQQESVIAITLLRGVGALGKADLAVRPGRPSGVALPTPDAQCCGTTVLEYALITHARFDEATLHQVAAAYDAQPLVVQNKISMDNIQKKHGQFIDFIDYETLTTRISQDIAQLPLKDLGVIRFSDARLVVSAVKKHEERDTLIVRVYNPTSKTIPKSAITFGIDITEGYAVGFGENRIKPLKMTDTRNFVISDLPSYTAKTFEFIMKKDRRII